MHRARRLSAWFAGLALALAACGTPRVELDPPVAVTVVVDFGTAGRGVLTEQTLVPAGASPIEALAHVVAVQRQYVSRTAGDVFAIEGVAPDQESGLFWDWRLNGRRTGQAPDRYQVQNGDQITWKYVGGGRPEYER